jgi:hypothetical protein
MVLSNHRQSKTYLFISDLHLSPEHPRLVRGFLDLLVHYQNKQTQLSKITVTYLEVNPISFFVKVF